MAIINGYSNFFSESLQNYFLSSGPDPKVATLYCALAQGTTPETALPDSELGGGQECLGAGYDRIPVLTSGEIFGLASTSSGITTTTTISDLIFGVAISDWPDYIQGFVLCLSSTKSAATFASTDIIFGGSFNTSKQVFTNDIPIIKPGGLIIRTKNQ